MEARQKLDAHLAMVKNLHDNIHAAPILTRLIALDNMGFLTPDSSVDPQELSHILTLSELHKAIKTGQELLYDGVPWLIIRRTKILAWVIKKYYDQFLADTKPLLKADISELVNEILVKAPGLHGINPDITTLFDRCPYCLSDSEAESHNCPHCQYTQTFNDALNMWLIDFPDYDFTEALESVGAMTYKAESFDIYIQTSHTLADPYLKQAWVLTYFNIGQILTKF